ncbi:MAG: cytochrome C oxidase subunit IV family protein [Isosphaeraceae bacterium]
MNHEPMSVRVNLLVFLALLILLFATIGAAYLPLGRFHLATALTIATAKAVLIGLFFMHLYQSHRVTWIVSTASLLWLGILLALTLSDYLSRGWLRIPGK